MTLIGIFLFSFPAPFSALLVFCPSLYGADGWWMKLLLLSGHLFTDLVYFLVFSVFFVLNIS